MPITRNTPSEQVLCVCGTQILRMCVSLTPTPNYLKEIIISKGNNILMYTFAGRESTRSQKHKFGQKPAPQVSRLVDLSFNFFYLTKRTFLLMYVAI